MAIIKLYDYTELVDDGWFGEYEQFFVIGQGKLSAGVVTPLIEAVPDNEEIKVKINSVGGYVFDGWAIYNALIASKTRGCKVSVQIDGLAASIASIIAMAGDTVTMAKASMLMIHKPTVDLFWCGSMDAEMLKKEAQTLDKIQAVLNSIYLDKTGLDSAVIDSMINTETWITPQEAVTMGFANSIATSENTKPTMAENAFRHIFKNADQKTRAYANSIININKNNMADNAKEITEAVKESTKATNSLVSFFNKMFKNEGEEVPEVVNETATLEDGTTVYFAGALEIGTAIYSDEEMTALVDDATHVLDDGRSIVTVDGLVTEIIESVIEEDLATENEALKNEIETLKAQNTALNKENRTLHTSLNSANGILNKLKETKSNFKPATPDQKFDKPKSNSATEKLDLSKEAREARKQELLDKKNKK